jgi:hypothetical protein
VGIFTSRKIRQFPPHFGNSSLVQHVHEPKVVELTAQICWQLGLVGYVSIEFKQDARDGAFKIIELTPVASIARPAYPRPEAYVCPLSGTTTCSTSRWPPPSSPGRGRG